MQSVKCVISLHLPSEDKQMAASVP